MQRLPNFCCLLHLPSFCIKLAKNRCNGGADGDVEKTVTGCRWSDFPLSCLPMEGCHGPAFFQAEEEDEAPEV